MLGAGWGGATPDDELGRYDAIVLGLLPAQDAQQHPPSQLPLLPHQLPHSRQIGLTDACTFGARVAALTCSVPGANPPRAELVS